MNVAILFLVLQKRAEMEMKTASEEEAKRMADEQAKLQSINNANADLRVSNSPHSDTYCWGTRRLSRLVY